MRAKRIECRILNKENKTKLNKKKKKNKQKSTVHTHKQCSEFANVKEKFQSNIN